MRNRNESFDIFNCYKYEVENQKEKIIKIFRSIGGEKYFPH